MKKKIVMLLTVTMLCAGVTACGSTKEASVSGETTTVYAQESSESNQPSGEQNESEGRTVGPDSKWDGYMIDRDGIKIKPGMTIKEIADQGCIVFPDYGYDADVMESSVTEMSVSPSYNLTDNSILYIWKKNDDGNYSKAEFSEKVWFCNPYPYAVSFGDCVVKFMLPNVKQIKVDWDVDGNGVMSPEELKELFDIAPYRDKYDNYIYPYENYYLEFKERDEDELFLSFEAMAYEIDDTYPIPDCLSGFEDKAIKKYESTSEYLDTSLDSYTFTMGLDTYSIDLTYFESIEEIYRSYIPDSDYSKVIKISGTSVNGDNVTVTIEEDRIELYYKALEYLTYGSCVDSEELPSGEIHNAMMGADNQNQDKLFNNTIRLTVDVSTGKVPDVNYTMEVYHQVENLISVN